jgi:hypothetical protein
MAAQPLPPLTNSRQQRFLEAYTACLNQFVQAIIEHDTDIENPKFVYMDVFRLIDKIAQPLRACYADVFDDLDHWREPIKNLDYYYLRPLTHQAIERLYKWWLVTCHDYEHIPPPSEMDHTIPVRLTHWQDIRGTEHKRALRFGQIVYVGSSSKKYGYADLYDYSSGRWIAKWRTTTTLSLPGEQKLWSQMQTEEVKQCAKALSSLTDWKQYDSLPRRVQRALDTRARALIEQAGGSIPA